MRARKNKSLGQTASEYMLVISVIVLALTAAVYTPMKQAIQDGASDYKDKYEEAGKQGYMGQASDGKR